jgi:hypothetical protein
VHREITFAQTKLKFVLMHMNRAWDIYKSNYNGQIKSLKEIIKLNKNYDQQGAAVFTELKDIYLGLDNKAKAIGFKVWATHYWSKLKIKRILNKIKELSIHQHPIFNRFFSSK